jgi:hypothetical protein
MSDSPQVVSSVVVDETGTVIVHDSRPDNLKEYNSGYAVNHLFALDGTFFFQNCAK